MRFKISKWNLTNFNGICKRSKKCHQKLVCINWELKSVLHTVKKKKKNVRFYTIYLDSGVSAMKGSGEVECKLPIVQGHEIAAAHLQHLRKIRHICSLKMRRNNSYPFLCDYLM